MDIDLKKEWARLYDDKFPNNNVVKFDEETGEYSFIPMEERNKHEKL